MGVVTVLTADKTLELVNVSVVSGAVNASGHLILTTYGGSAIDAGLIVVPDASDTVKGTVELATDVEVQTGTDVTRAVTPAGLTSRVASSSATGLVELATSVEVQTGTDDTRAVTPAGLTSRAASSSATGLVELATSAEVQTGTDDIRAVTPAGLASRAATSTATGLVELATNAEVQTGTDAIRAVTPSGLASAYVPASQKAAANGVATLDSANNLAQFPNSSRPKDAGYIAWTSDPLLVGNNFTPITQKLYLIRLELRNPDIISKVALGVFSAGSAAVASVGIYDSAGTLRGSASPATLSATGPVWFTLTSPYSAPAGYVFAAVLITSATTSPTIYVYNATAAYASFANANLTAATYRFSTNGTTVTSLPATITPSGNVQSAPMAAWAALL